MVYGDIMKFKQYINETDMIDLSFLIDDDVADELTKKLKKECAQYLKEMGRGRKENWLYRSTEHQFDIFKKFTPRINRKPRNTPKEIHRMMDDLFKKKFGWKARSEGVFTSSDISQLENVYGEPYMFFPIGNYKYVYHPTIRDIFMEMDNYKYIDIDGNVNIKAIEIYLSEHIPKYKNNNLHIAYKNGVEVAFKCKSYYLVRRLYEDALKELLYGLK